MKIIDLVNAAATSYTDTRRIAAEFAKTLVNGDFVALYGDLGAGKTCFTGAVVEELFPTLEFAGSPTYALVNEYDDGHLRLCHFDMYRITDDDDLYSIGFYDYEDCIIITEWSENIPYALPPERYEVHIEKTSDDARTIKITKTVKD